MAFEFPQKVLFKHCDPAGIVFYPRYFEMMNDCLEAFFEAQLDMPWHLLHRAGAVPTAQIETRFTAPSRHGDRLLLRLQVTRVGRSSFSYEMVATCDDEQRFVTTGTLVNVNETGRPAPWPEGPRTRLEAQL
ncbi:thioesterase [Actibacterium mucosum KCTC 23349]|uniref:Thioesterase n=1 Tax=Actibacterium mucosum KCTC 23349 TaxID=1454373 RepID=A0A037ZJU6_9RHOB|nr:thioesterase family protein [Actibacterium mucosum]KAJ55822.1 thioesterase [Actibacterium mucosum KCTC 23349]